MTLIEKLILNKKITNEEIEDELIDICDKVYYGNNLICHEDCPIFTLNDNDKVRNENKYYKENSGCECYKDGHKMRMFIIFKNRENEKNLIEN